MLIDNINYLQKPFAAKELMSKVRDILDGTDPQINEALMSDN